MTEHSLEQDARARLRDAVVRPDPQPVVRLVAVSDRPLDVAAHEAAAGDAHAGAHVTFVGTVRDHDHDRQVTELEYEGHPTAEQVLHEILDEFAADPDVLALAAGHRVGRLAIGDVAIVVVVACAHRREAFAICGRLVDEIKARLPIWKRQVFADGTDEWVDCP